jgi:hypothetical protein
MNSTLHVVDIDDHLVTDLELLDGRRGAAFQKLRRFIKGNYFAFTLDGYILLAREGTARLRAVRATIFSIAEGLSRALKP